MGTRSSRVLVAVVATGVILLTLVCVEGILRYKGLGEPILYYMNSSYRFAPLPDQRKVRRRGATVTINSIGLRSVDEWSDQADLRLLFIGDSVTWSGTHIDDVQTFPHLVAVYLGELLGKKVISGNAGVNAYGTDNMAERIRYDTPKGADAIVVTLIARDTVRGLVDLRAQYFFTDLPPGPFRATMEVVRFATFWTFHGLHYTGPERFDDDRFDVSRRSLERLFDILRERQKEGSRVLIVLSPLRRKRDPQESELLQHVQGVLGDSGLPVLDLHETVAREHTEDTYYDDTHLDVQGHEVYGRAIANELNRLLRSPQ
jgi:lysophospholipase L1-like esterase